MNRIVSLDIAKAICIILVVIGHYAPTHAPNWYMLLNNVIYTFHMPLFMFASGYIYIATKKDVDYRTFLLNKIRRLMIPYFTTSVIVISIKLFTQGQAYVENPVTYISFLKMFYLPEAGYFLWFIWALWWMFVLVPLFKSKQSRDVLFVVALLLHYIPMQLPDLFCIAQFKNMLVFFMLGVFVYENKKVNIFISEFHWIKLACAIGLFIVAEEMYVCSNMVGVIFFLLSRIVPYIGIWFVLEISKWIVRGWNRFDKERLLLQISASSYIIYLFHTTFEGFAKAICHKLPLEATLWYVFIPESCIVILAGVFVPMLLYKYLFKRFAIAKFLFGL